MSFNPKSSWSPDLASLRTYLSESLRVARPERLVLGVSGGVDSMVLCHLVGEANRALGGVTEILWVHLNYGLRTIEADLDEALVRAEALRAGVRCEVIGPDRWEPAFKGEGTQEWARRIRMAAFKRVLGPSRGAIVLAHHHDDLVETIFFRLARGTSAGGMLGMEVFKAPYWRPLLGLDKKTLIAFASRQNLPHRHDSSNDTLVYSRNRIRHELCPRFEELHPGAGQKLVSLARECRELSEFVYSLLAKGFYYEKSMLPLQSLRELPESVAMALIAQFCRSHGAKELSRALLKRALEQVRAHAKRPWQEALPGGGAIRIDQRGLHWIS